MTKLRKQRKRKVFKHNVNRKRLRNKINSLGNISCKEIKDAWESKKSLETNLKEMGLSCDPNKTIKIPYSRKQIEASLSSNKTEWEEHIINEEPTNEKSKVAKILEDDAKAPRQRKIRLPKSQVEWLSYLIKKYGNDFKAMAHDNKNYNQETWKQIRQKILRFRSIPEQYNKFLQENNLKPICFDLNISDDEL